MSDKLIRILCAKECVFTVRKEILDWVEGKRKSAVVKFFRLMINCAQVASLHYQFMISLSAGDNTILEAFHRELLLIIVLTKKSHNHSARHDGLFVLEY